jgi:tetratricopeptide (TPR) repeat protein
MISFALAPNRTLAFWGSFLWGTGALFVLALVGSWAVGVAAGPRVTAWVEKALLVGAAANAAVAVLQMTTDLSSFQLWRVDGRSSGFWGNPVYLSGFLVGAVWLVVPRLRARPAVWGAFVALLAAALQVAGGRFAAALLVVAVAGAWRAAGGRTAALLAVCLGAGLLLGTGLARQHGGVSVTSRATGEAATGVRPRLESWISARHAIAARPLLGFGPGRYRAATGRFRTLRLAREEGPDRLYADAHNLVVEYGATTGLPGLALFLAWIGLAVRWTGWRAPLAGFALLVLAMHLVEPQNVGLTPLAFLALGAAAPLVAAPASMVPISLRALAVGAALALAGVILLGTYRLEQARLDFRLADARQARDLLPPWPEVRDQTARIYTFEAKSRRAPALLAPARRWRWAAVVADSDDPTWWNDLAEAELNAKLTRPAARHFGEALRRNPWSVRALNGLARIELVEGRPAPAGQLFRKSLLVDPQQPQIRDLAGRA